MGREVRRVPPDWQHPSEGTFKDGTPRYIPLFDGSDYTLHLGYHEDEKKDSGDDGVADYPFPNKSQYMPIWPPGEATHLMMYETCTEGTPISPPFATPEQLARWLADTGASAFGGETASYEAWLIVAKGRPSISAVIQPGKGMLSGVEFAALERRP